MGGDSKNSKQPKFFPTAILIGVILVLVILVAIVSLAGWQQKFSANSLGNSSAVSSQPLVTTPVTNPAINTFEMKKDATICRENGKPVVYLFSTTECPHCKWIHDTFDRVINEYVAAGKIDAYHWQLDTGDNTLTPAAETQVPASDVALYQQFNPDNSVPTFIFGCKYFRVGNGYETENNLGNEEKEFRAVLDDLLKNQ